MNIPKLGEKIMPYLIRLAESSQMQVEIENQSLSIFQRVIRWIRNKLQKGDKKMSGIVNITVKNDNGVALANVSINYLVNGITVPATTDTNGLYSVTDLPAGIYDFEAVLNGYNTGKISLNVLDGASVEGVITLTATVINTAEQTVSSAITAAESNNTTTVSQDWNTIKAAAESAISGLSANVSSSDLSSSTVLTGIYSQITTVIQTAITKVDAYKSQLMISRHSKNFWECVLIDAKLAGITIFEYFIAKEVNKIKSEIESKISKL